MWDENSIVHVKGTCTQLLCRAKLGDKKTPLNISLFIIIYGWKDLSKVEYNCPHKYP